MRYVINNKSAFFIIILALCVFSSQAWGNSLKYKLKMSGYSDIQIEEILRGYRTFKDIQSTNQSTLTASNEYQPVQAPQHNSRSKQLSKSKRHPLAVRFFKSFIKKRKASHHNNSAKHLSSADIRQSIKERYFYHKRPVKIDLIDHIKNDASDEAHTTKDRFVESAKPYLNYVEDASYENNVKKSLILAVIKVESGFNHRAVSPKGAQGLMQLMPFTAKSMGVTNPFDPVQNIHAGTRYLSQCLKKLQNTKLALAAYNAGITRVSRMCKIPPFQETQNFVKDVLRYEKMYDRMIRDL